MLQFIIHVVGMLEFTLVSGYDTVYQTHHFGTPVKGSVISTTYVSTRYATIKHTKANRTINNIIKNCTMINKINNHG